jgi:hypothetical protein
MEFRSFCEGEAKFIQDTVGKCEGRDHWEGLDVDKRIILIWILKIRMKRSGLY